MDGWPLSPPWKFTSQILCRLYKGSSDETVNQGVFNVFKHIERSHTRVVHVSIYFTVCKFYMHVKDPVVHVSIYFTIRKFCLTFHPFPFRSWIVAPQPRLGFLATDTHQNHTQQESTVIPNKDLQVWLLVLRTKPQLNQAKELQKPCPSPPPQEKTH